MPRIPSCSSDTFEAARSTSWGVLLDKVSETQRQVILSEVKHYHCLKRFSPIHDISRR